MAGKWNYNENVFSGMLVVNKEPGFTSSDVVSKLRGILHMKKIGHTGTLDPDAVGVLPVCLGTGTKIAQMIEAHDKEYRAVMRLGIVTDTQDMSGQVLEEISAQEVRNRVTPEKLHETISRFVGPQEQIPPMYSAVRIDGKRLYEYARAGREVERTARQITVNEIEVEEIRLPEVTMRISCSRGTYIRTLCEDIGRALGVGGCMQHLTRTRVGQFALDQAMTLGEIEEIMSGGEEKMAAHIIPVDRFFDTAPAVHVKASDMPFLRNGNPLGPDNMTEGVIPHEDRVRVYDEEGLFWAIYHYDANRNRILPVRMFRMTDSVQGDTTR